MNNFKFAFKKTIPVLIGYLFFGAAFGLMLQKVGYNMIWAFFIAILAYSGSMQFVLVGFLANPISLVSAAVMTFSVNSRHVFYGLSFIEKFKAMGKKGLYMIYTLTDETYSLLCDKDVPVQLDEKKVFLYIAALNQLYWVIGCTMGALLGQVLPFDTTGVDFAMTAMFVVIFVEQWQAAKTHIPAVTGLVSASICLVVFGADKFILPALILVVVTLFSLKNIIHKGENSNV